MLLTFVLGMLIAVMCLVFHTKPDEDAPFQQGFSRSYSDAGFSDGSAYTSASFSN